MKYAEVILPLPLYSTFTYSIPESIGNAAQIGCRVLVPFGKKKIYTGIITLLHNNRPGDFEVKDIISILDNYPILRHPQLKFWEWISEYNLCSIGDVYKAAVPSGLKIESETFISVNPDYEEAFSGELKDRERIIYDLASSRNRVQLGEISRSTGFKNVESVVSKMLEKDAIFISEKVVDNYKPKTESFIALTIEQGDDDGIHKLFDLVKRSGKQEQLLLAYLDLSHWLQKKKKSAEVSKQSLLERAGVSQYVLKSAIDKNIFKIYKKEINRFTLSADTKADLPILSEEQQRPVSPALFFVHKSNSEDYDPTVELGGQRVTDFATYKEDFRRLLQGVLEELFDPEIPFRQTSFASICDYCDYKLLCGK